MKKILILGGTGMLGNGVTQAFKESNQYNLYSSIRLNSPNLVEDYKSKFGNDIKIVGFDVLNGNLAHLLTKENPPDYIINCIGVILPFINDNMYASTYINSAFPHQLSQQANECGAKLIHVTTDCVFDGQKGRYTEDDPHTAKDLYGRSKSLGEPEDCMVLRTSLVGLEMHKFASLISWAISQKGKEVNGFTNHFWNGVTTLEYGNICKEIIEQDFYKVGKFHVFSPGKPLTKLIMLKMISDRYKLDLKIKPHETPKFCDRSLGSVHELSDRLNIKHFREQLKAM